MKKKEGSKNKLKTAEWVIVSETDVQNALRLWHGGEKERWPLAHLRLGLQIAAEQELLDSLADSGLAVQNRTILNLGLEHLGAVSVKYEELLRQRYEHGREVQRVANSRNLTKGGIHYQQRQAISQLTEILNQLEKEANQEWREQMVARLELPTYSELVGVSKSRQTLVEALLEEDKHFIVAIDGLGGLGKTALADRITRDMLQTVRFDETVWITAKQTHLSTRGRLQIDTSRPVLTFPMLIDELAARLEQLEDFRGSQVQKQRLIQRLLKERPCLVVVDNLETVADYKALIPELQQWQNPSKFLITSRIRLLDQPGVFSISLQELEETAVYHLIRLEAAKIGFTVLENASDSELKQIYEVVGGNPLALKLVIGQLRFHSLPRILARLSESQNEEGEGLFDYIYRESWESLDDNSRTILLSLTQAGETGFTFEHLSDITGLAARTIEQSLEELILLSLVDLRGSLLERRYSMHHLTERFLLKMLEQT